jgi:hypothetical protein
MTNDHAAAVVVALASLACSSNLGPKSGITLLVTNSTCLTGQCDSVEVLAFPAEQPRTPGGYWSLDLGLLTNRSKCFTLPPSATFRVIAVSSSGGPNDTTTFTWTTADPVSLGAQAPSGPRLQATPSTSGFVPDESAGWSVTLPSGTRPSNSSACVGK